MSRLCRPLALERVVEVVEVEVVMVVMVVTVTGAARVQEVQGGYLQQTQSIFRQGKLQHLLRLEGWQCQQA